MGEPGQQVPGEDEPLVAGRNVRREADAKHKLNTSKHSSC